MDGGHIGSADLHIESADSLEAGSRFLDETGISARTQAAISAILLCCASATAAATINHWIDAGKVFIGVDFRWFYAAARMPAEVIYSGPPYAYIYPPTGIALLRPLALAGPWTGFVILAVVSSTCFIAAVRRVAGWKIAGLSMLSASAIQGLLWGQTPMLLAAALFAALSLRDFRKGMIVGALLVLKPQIFVAAPFVFALRREFTTLAGIAIGSSLMVGLSIILYGPQLWIDWLVMLPAAGDALLPFILKSTIASPIGLAHWAAWPVWPFIMGSLAVAAWIIARSRQLTDPVATAAVIGGASILCAPYSLSHDVILLVPAAVAVIVGRPHVAQIPAVAVMGGTCFPIAIPSLLLLLGARWRTSAARSSHAWPTYRSLWTGPSGLSSSPRAGQTLGT